MKIILHSSVYIQDGEIEESGRVTFGDELLGTNGLYDSFNSENLLCFFPFL